VVNGRAAGRNWEFQAWGTRYRGERVLVYARCVVMSAGEVGRRPWLKAGVHGEEQGCTADHVGYGALAMLARMR
jgi:hypothetical protein